MKWSAPWRGRIPEPRGGEAVGDEAPKVAAAGFTTYRFNRLHVIRDRGGLTVARE